MLTDKGRVGSFTIFGFVRQPKTLLQRRLSDRLGIAPRIMDFGNAGRFFFYTTYGDVAENDGALVFKSGFARTPTKSPLSSRELLEQRIATPQSVNQDLLHGNALVACFSKREAQFVAFKNLLSQPQLYYWASGDELIGSDSLRCLLDVLDRVELNEDIIPFHFVLRHAPGPLTYFKEVYRLFPGQVLKWKEGRLDICRVQDLHFSGNGYMFDRVDHESVASLCQEMKEVMRGYVSQINQSGYRLGNMLSGGVDSSLLQVMINEHWRSTPAESFSFVPADEPSFEFEVKYAQAAADIFKTEHSFVDFTPQDYPDLLVKTIRTLGQPMISHIEPCKLLIASFLAEHKHDLRYCFTGLAADALFGLDVAKKIKGLCLLHKIPGSGLLLAVGGKLLKPCTWRSQTLLKAAEILCNWENPQLLVAPTNASSACAHFDIVCRVFGGDKVRQVLEYRRNLEEQYLSSKDHTERVHAILLLSYFYEIEAQSGQLFLACDKEQVYPFMDDDILRISFAFRPEVRYLKGLRVKPSLKEILEQCGLASIARKRKGGSVFPDALDGWMRSGPLHDMIQTIDRPGFLSKADFSQALQKPHEFTWDLLTFDIFQKQVLAG